jgi:hypothetical protein
VRARANRTAAAIFALALLPLIGCAELGGITVEDLLAVATATTSAGPDEATTRAGLKEALRIGSENAVRSTSKLDGFLGNALIRIAAPPELEDTAKALRTIGFGSQVDEVEVAMNRAAEQAAGEATDVFLDAISRMTIQDAVGILNGGETAATDYFQRTTSDTLRSRFSPIVDTKMNEVGLVRLYDDVVNTARALPLVPVPQVDLRSYVTDRSLDGLFTVLSQEEQKIRTDPSARVTELLRTVFGP